MTLLLARLKPFRGAAPQRVAKLRAKEAEMTDPGRADVGRRDGEEFGLDRRKSRAQEFDGAECRPGIVGQTQRAQAPWNFEKFCKP